MTTRHPVTTRRAFLQAAAALAAALPFATYAQSGTKLKIGTLGSGRVGSAIGRAWVKAGHEVMFSSINLEADKQLAASIGKGAYAGTPREAAAFSTVVLVSVPYAAMPAIGRDLGEALKGKVIIDTSNPIVARDGDMAVAAREKGAGLASTEFLPGTRIVRA
ncbi:MAG: NAD(P)-binding domain-containing protein, partial [Proteobacteria bacterium]|nr:NAD(P)-binding domain-containing protein [Pseudomonadota bacterium]